MKKRYILTILVSCIGWLQICAQSFLSNMNNTQEERKSSWRTDEDTVAEKENVPIG